jgi:DNA-binding MarR family transcriptional regulator
VANSSLTLDDFLPYRLSFTSNLVSDTIAVTYDALFGLRIPEWRLIAVTAENPGGITQHEIGLKTRMDKVTVSRAAISLIERGLMTRQPNVADRRSHHLKLTPAGRELYETVVPKILELERRVFAEFSAEDLARLGKMLRRIEAVALELQRIGPKAM